MSTTSATSTTSTESELMAVRMRLRGRQYPPSQLAGGSDLDQYRWQAGRTFGMSIASLRTLLRWSADVPPAPPAPPVDDPTVEVPMVSPPSPAIPPSPTVEVAGDGMPVDVSIGDATGLHQAIAHGEPAEHRIRRHRRPLVHQTRHRPARGPLVRILAALTTREYWRTA